MDDRLKLAREAVKATLTIQSHTGCNCREEIDAGKWDKGHKVRAVLYAIAKLEAERDALREALGRLVYDIDALAESSSGVTGLHQNGDTAPWSELLEGGASEPWLGEAMAQARDALDPTHTPAGN